MKTLMGQGIRRIPAGIFVVLALAHGMAVQADEALFDDDDLLEVTLRGPLDSVLKKQSGRPEYSFELQVDDQVLPVQVRYRGKSRLQLCPFPPLRWSFSDNDDPASRFAGLDKVKVVTHCKSGSKGSEDAILNEYLAYRIFNLLSDSSYRVRLLRVTYQDTEGKTRKLDRPYYAFLIEPDEHLAQRLQGEVLEEEGVSFRELDEEQTASVSVFEYFIGNSDWSLARAYEAETCCHNVDLVSAQNGWQPIPYDFDLTVLVDAPYRGPFAANQARAREYRGYCQSSEASLATALAEIRANESVIMRLAQETPAIDQKALRKRIRFLESYFDSEDKDLLERFQGKCIG